MFRLDGFQIVREILLRFYNLQALKIGREAWVGREELKTQPDRS